MSDQKYFTPEEVTERYRGTISLGTLRNWRSMRIGPAFVKVGKSVLYPAKELDVWDKKNTVACRAAKRLIETDDDQA
ncbi:DNA-binding protein [Mesorhizobium sp. M2A.F.Ca.ET.042.01.1.1]|uniref:helix-turn-helix domain-containing protein n=1 Tax=Mesorhizobium sp. M2A.F.Ca.ET.042.01.1.1 TaxID=2496745 RepID=UPI000FCC5EAB|nr:helix-turn-helix domain-containing protein [Mesorhizobium sp. M2A.F.Ca.ET.042.01.1.1]RUX26050.1 DNA-binding protein [Mesorhizobium sp. M2A.F.Ca.ET.042.01.1.1]